MKKKKFLRTLGSLVMSVSLAASCLPISALADEATLQIVSEDEIDSDQMLLMYFEMGLYGNNASTYSTSRYRERLSDSEKKIYDAAKEMFAKVDSGDNTRTLLNLTFGDFGVNESVQYPVSDFVGDDQSLFDDKNELTDEALLAILDKLDIDLLGFLDALLKDCPYEMFWFSNEIQVFPEYTFDDDNKTISFDKNNKINIGFVVDGSYSPTETDGYTIDSDKIKSVNLAIENAKRIVEEEAEKENSDYDKLQDYVNILSEYNEYNFDALTTGYVDNVNPWQIIYMFDGDPNTKVVCEGYAKSFQYLCEITEFDSPEVYCYSVSGNLSGPHMWNIVHMDDGRQYLVDVTNYDKEDGNYVTTLFMGVPVAGDVSSGYSLPFYDRTLTYVYDSDTMALYTTEELTLSSLEYGETETDTKTDEEPSSEETSSTEESSSEETSSTEESSSTDDSSSEEASNTESDSTPSEPEASEEDSNDSDTGNQDEDDSNSSTTASSSSSAQTVATESQPTIGDSKGWDAVAQEVDRAIAQAIATSSDTNTPNNSTNTDASTPVVVSINMNGADTVPAKVISAIAGKEVLLGLSINANTLVIIDGSQLTEADVSDIKIKVGKSADGSDMLSVRAGNVNMENNIVVYSNLGTNRVGSEAILNFVNSDNSLVEFRISPIYENGFAAFVTPMVNANYKITVR